MGADNSRFEGTYWFSKKHGKGKFYWAEGAVYEGEFVENDIHGAGEYRWWDGRVYIGEWHRNHIHGTGRMQWSDGRLYEGNYYEDKKHGTGCFTWPDGRRYDGQWKDGKRIRWVDEEHDFEPEEGYPSPRDVARPDRSSQDADGLNASPQNGAAEGQRTPAPEHHQRPGDQPEVVQPDEPAEEDMPPPSPSTSHIEGEDMAPN